jgi:hypothetical protein
MSHVFPSWQLRIGVFGIPIRGVAIPVFCQRVLEVGYFTVR